MKSRRLRLVATLASGLLAAGLLAACGSSSSDNTSSDTSTGSSASGSSNKSVTIGMASGWAEDTAVSHLWKYVLEQKGYKVTLKELDIAPVFVGVSKGDLDLFFDTWLPTTHEDYWKQYGDKVDDLGIWYKNAPLTITVPAYMKDVNSIGDLKNIGDEVDWTIVGIDPGAGLTRVTKTKAMPAYGLKKYTLKTSSTPAMLAALKSAMDDKKPIVVTLWHPHWAYSAFDLKDLKDPKGAMGKPDSIHSISSKKFAESNPKVVDAVKNFKMDDKTLADLEKVVLQDNKDDLDKGVQVWAKDNQDFIDSMMS